MKSAVGGVLSKGLPGEEKPSYEYDANSRLKKAGTTSYEYDAANNPTKIGTSTYEYDEANELKSGPSGLYSYNSVGQRTKLEELPPTTSYGYDQASNLTSVERPKEGTKPAISDTYTYDATGMRASETIGATTSYLVWETAEELSLLLTDGTNSYIYGPYGLPVEQINNTTGAVLYLHHDQQGSTRLLTGTTGKTEATMTYDAYGNTTGTTGTAKTPLGYDAEYTSSDTGLVYLRARVYDPKTAQFLSLDPLDQVTGEPYTYAGDNPLNAQDPTGLLSWSEFGQALGVGIVCVASDGAGCIAAGLLDADANVAINDYEAATNPCRATEEENKSLTDVIGLGLSAGVGRLAEGPLTEAARTALERSSQGQAAMKQLFALGATSSTLTTLEYAREHETASSGCPCGR